MEKGKLEEMSFWDHVDELRSTLLTYLESNVISYVKSGNTKLFATLKARR